MPHAHRRSGLIEGEIVELRAMASRIPHSGGYVVGRICEMP
jgi:hypothetical protein